MRERDSWPLALLAREAGRNVFGAGARLIPLLFAAVLLGPAHIAVAVNASNDFSAQLSELESQGRHIFDIGPRGNPISDKENLEKVGVLRSSCERLAEIPGVAAAGVVVDPNEQIAVPQLGPGVPVRRVSPSLVPQLNDYDAVIGTTLGSSVGLTAGDSIRIIGPNDVLLNAIVAGGPELPSTLALFTTPTTNDEWADTCRVRLARHADKDRLLPSLAGGLVAKGAKVSVIPSLQESVDVVALHLNRTDRVLPLVAAVAGGLAAAVFSLLRSSELATYRLAGTSRRSLGLLLGFEYLLLAGVYLSSSLAAILVFRDSLFAPGATALWSLAGAFAWVAVGVILSLPILRRSPAEMAKDR